MSRAYEQYLAMYEISRDYGLKMQQIQYTILRGFKNKFNYNEALTALSNIAFLGGLLLPSPITAGASALVGGISFFSSTMPTEQEAMKSDCEHGYEAISDIIFNSFISDTALEAVKLDINVTTIENDDKSTVRYVTAMSNIKAIRKNGVWLTR